MWRQGLSPAIAAERLPGWRFNLKHIFIEAPPASVSQHDSATAVVQQLEQVQAPTATIHLQRWRWDADVAHVVAGAMPQLTHLQFAVRINGQLTDSLLGRHCVCVGSHCACVGSASDISRQCVCAGSHCACVGSAT